MICSTSPTCTPLALYSKECLHVLVDFDNINCLVSTVKTASCPLSNKNLPLFIH